MNAKQKLEEAVAKFFFNDSVILEAYCLMEKVEDNSIKTVAIDTRGTIPCFRYNPKFIEKLSTETLEFVLVSEGFRILFRHPTTRLKSPKEVSALASTLTINNCIHNTNFDEGINPESFGVEDFKKDSYFEFFFRWIIDNMSKTNQKLKKVGYEKGVGEESNEKSEGQGESQGGEQGEGQEQKDFKNEGEAVKEYMNPTGDATKYWGENGLFDADVKRLIDENKGSAKLWGKYTGSYAGEIIASILPKISCKDILRRFNTSVQCTTQFSSRMKINRRRDLEVPGHKRKYKSRILFAVDVSGSMSDSDLAEGFAVVNDCCRHSELLVCQFDTEIKMVDKKWKNVKKNIKIHGRGGTDFNQVIQYAEKERIDGLIIFSDMYAAEPQKPKKTKILWLGTNKNTKQPCNFGMFTYLDKFENN